VDQFRLRTATLVVAAALIGLGVGLATGLFGESDDEPAPPDTVAADAAPADPMDPEASEGEDPGDAAGEPDLPRTEDDPEGLSPGPSGPAPSSDDELAAADAARAYVEAIDQRKGRAICRALADGALDTFELPAASGSCPASVESSLGFSDSRGQPVWDHSEMTQDVSAQVNGDSARVVATIFTEYADVREPTIEDDIIYLARSGDRWLVVKPSATLYRAVGVADVPLEALRPPK
jgi:hypothetical protein